MASYSFYLTACVVAAVLILGAQGIAAWRQHQRRSQHVQSNP